MKRTTYTRQPVIPQGWTGRDFNNWAKYIDTQVRKLLFKKQN